MDEGPLLVPLFPITEKRSEVFYSTAGQIENVEKYSETLCYVAKAYVQSRQDSSKTFAEALIITEKIKYPDVRSQILVSIAQAQAKAGHFVNALSTTEKIEDVINHSEALCNIAQVQSGQDSTNTLTKAIKLIDQIPTDRHKDLNNLADQLCKIPAIAIKTSFLQEYLPRAAYYLESAYHACGLLAHLYPSHATAIAKLLGVSSAPEET